MYGVTFGEFHSWYDLGLVLTKCEINPPKPKTKYIDVPFSNGSIDLTEANGSVYYDDIDCKFTFAILPCDFEERRKLLEESLNGFKVRITLDKDPQYYFVGRLTIDSFKVEKTVGTVVVSARCEPNRYEWGDE